MFKNYLVRDIMVVMVVKLTALFMIYNLFFSDRQVVTDSMIQTKIYSNATKDLSND